MLCFGIRPRSWAIPALITASLLGSACTPRVQVFYSPTNDGTVSPGLSLPADGSQVELPVWLKPSVADRSTPGLGCSGQGAGTEVCRWQLSISAKGSVRIVSFRAAAGVQMNLTAETLAVSGGNPIAPDVSPEPVGSLTVRSTGEGSIVAQGSYVDSSLALAEIPAQMLATASPL